jgi:peptidyl-prolyl cis-trans isomerase D
MREYFRSLKFILVVIILAFIATSVVYFGTSVIGGGANRPNVVATVNGEEIPTERFRRAQASVFAAFENMSKQRVTPELAERLGLNQQVISDLVTDAVVVQGAAHEGVRVSDDELRAHIQQMREFQEDGRFSHDRYVRVLRQARLEPGEFESEMRRALVRQRMETLIRGGVKVSEAELQDAYRLRHERVRAAWASMDAQPLMASVVVTDAELEPYLKDHPAQFTRPERRRVQYVLVSPGVSATAVSDQDIEAYYREHGSEFEQPRRLHVAHILVRVPQVGGSEAENKAKAKVEVVIKRALAGEDFAKLAKENSEDTANAAQGGDLGWVGTGDLVPQFEQAAFALKKGEVSPAPVRTPFGYHAIKLLDVREGGKSPVKEVSAKIREKLVVERSDSAARAKAEEVRPALMSAKDFGAEAQTLGLSPREGAFARGEALAGVGREPQLEEAVFGLAVGGISAPIKTPAGYALVKVLAQIPAGVPPLAEIKDSLTEAVKRERATSQAMDRAKALVASLAKGGDFASTAKTDGFFTGETPLFSRAEPPKGSGTLPGGVLLAVFQTAVGKVSEPVRAGMVVYVVKTLERQPPDPQAFDAQRAELAKQLLAQKQNQVWDNWVKARRGNTKVEMAGGGPPPPGY